MKKLLLILFLIPVAFSTGCFSPSTEYTHAGFLENYERLAENKNVENSIIWVDPNIDNTPVKTIYVAPVLLLQQKGDDAKDFIDVSKGQFKRLSTDLHDALVRELQSAGYTVTDNPRGVEQLHIAITGLTTVPEDVAIYEILPIMAVIDTSRAAIGYRSDEVYLFLETQFRDKNNKPDAEAVTYVTGVSMSPSAIDEITPEQVQEQAVKFSENFVKHIDPLLKRQHASK